MKPTDYDEVFTDGPDKKAETKAEASEEENLNEEDADKASPVQPVSEVWSLCSVSLREDSLSQFYKDFQ